MWRLFRLQASVAVFNDREAAATPAPASLGAPGTSDGDHAHDQFSIPYTRPVPALELALLQWPSHGRWGFSPCAVRGKHPTNLLWAVTRSCSISSCFPSLRSPRCPTHTHHGRTSRLLLQLCVDPAPLDSGVLRSALLCLCSFLLIKGLWQLFLLLFPEYDTTTSFMKSKRES